MKLRDKLLLLCDTIKKNAPKTRSLYINFR